MNHIEENSTMIDMIIPIHIEDEKVIFEEDLAVKIKFFGENIEQNLAKYFRGLEVILSYKT